MRVIFEVVGAGNLKHQPIGINTIDRCFPLRFFDWIHDHSPSLHSLTAIV